MYLHANAKLGPAGRLALVRTIEGGCSIRAAASVLVGVVVLKLWTAQRLLRSSTA